MVTQINISNNVESDEMRGKTVLVFLKPQNPQGNYQIPAWQVLTGVPGTTEAFVYDHQIPFDVYSHGAGDDMKMTPERQSRQPQASLTQQQQDGAISKTNPYIQFDSDWYVNARPVVTMQPVDAHSATATEGDVTLNRNPDL
ncbi:hypothetical protein [Janthinobacterium tructae]|uniref:hypothetical protein n=1 Tax=Janthinobacterium tructae TaxID=2590869 RepID=UPI00249B0371|nr:hypothetical protein [Janthinobacterium tructae]MDI3296680.1 hypothetical protein [Janthinobacterium tructae]